jgi:hypothetical protein
MSNSRSFRILNAFLALAAVAGIGASAPESTEHWEIAGTLTEACTCSVPCTCNFGEAPSPHHYCWSVYSLEIEKGHYGAVTLDSLHLAVAHAQSDRIAYIDETATPEQSAALKAIGSKILSAGSSRPPRLLRKLGALRRASRSAALAALKPITSSAVTAKRL